MSDSMSVIKQGWYLPNNAYQLVEIFGWKMLKAVCIGSSNIPYLSELKLAFELIYMINITSVITFIFDYTQCRDGFYI